MYLASVRLPTPSATCAQTVLTELVRACVRLMSPNDSPPSLLNDAPEIVLGMSPLSTESGENLPESIPATAVTTLNVDPGGYWPWVVRLSSGASGSWFRRPKMSGTSLGLYCG